MNKLYPIVLYLTRENGKTARKREKNAKQSFAAHLLSRAPSMTSGKSTVCLGESIGSGKVQAFFFVQEVKRL